MNGVNIIYEVLCYVIVVLAAGGQHAGSAGKRQQDWMEDKNGHPVSRRRWYKLYVCSNLLGVKSEILIVKKEGMEKGLM